MTPKFDPIPAPAGRFQVSEKRLINFNQVEFNQLMPFKYRWTFEYENNRSASHWMPNEVPTSRDIEI